MTTKRENKSETIGIDVSQLAAPAQTARPLPTQDQATAAA